MKKITSSYIISRAHKHAGTKHGRNNYRDPLYIEAATSWRAGYLAALRAARKRGKK